MTELKTTLSDASVNDFLESIPNQQIRSDCQTIAEIMQRATNSSAKMWGASIVGFDTYHYQYASGREGNSMRVGFSPRKQNITLYINGGFDQHQDLLAQLGKFTTAKVCLYIKRLVNVNLPILEKLIQACVDHMQEKYPET